MRERGSWDRRRKKEGKRPPSIEVSDKRGWRDKSRLPTPKLRDRHFGEQQPDNRKQHQSANQRRYTGWGWWSRTWVGLILFESFHCLPCSAWADGNLSKLAAQVGKIMVKHPSQSQPNLGFRQQAHPVDRRGRSGKSVWAGQMRNV